jgi:hypothetical protein
MPPSDSRAAPRTASADEVKVGDSASIAVPARPRWVETGVQLISGEAYQLSATGTWQDRNISSGPEGYPSRNAVMRFAERWRRMPRAPWFALIGSIGQDPGTVFVIGASTTFAPRDTGTLNCFANDVPLMYFNNTGSISLTVTRTR